MNEWFENNDYERDYSPSVYSFEANSLELVNPFDIPADQINYFDFEIFAPIK